MHWGQYAAYTRGMDYDTMKLKLAAREGQWSAIARESGVDRKTIYRMLTDPDYNPTFRTLRRLTLALRTVRAPRVSEPA